MRRYLVLYLVVFAVLALAIGLAARRDARQGAPPVASTWILGPEGYRAAFRLLEVSGVPVERQVAGFEDLPSSTGNLLVLAAPRARPVGELEATALRAWVARGNALVWATALGNPRGYAGELTSWDEAVRGAQQAEEHLQRAFEVRLDPPSDEVEAVERGVGVTVETLFTAGVSSVFVGPAVDLAVEGEDWLPLAGTVEGTSLRLKEVGRGRVWLLPTPHPFDNARIATADNVVFLRNLVRGELREGGKVLFDEHHHGYSASPILEVLSGRTFLTIAFHLALLFVLYGWARGVRFGPPVSVLEKARRPAVEYVDALAELLRRGGKTEETAAELVEDFRRRLERRAGIPALLPAAEAVERIERRTASRAEGLREALEAERRIRRGRDLVRLARRLRRTEQELYQRRGGS